MSKFGEVLLKLNKSQSFFLLLFHGLSAVVLTPLKAFQPVLGVEEKSLAGAAVTSPVYLINMLMDAFCTSKLID